jgi:hypothetical protein
LTGCWLAFPLWAPGLLSARFHPHFTGSRKAWFTPSSTWSAPEWRPSCPVPAVELQRVRWASAVDVAFPECLRSWAAHSRLERRFDVAMQHAFVMRVLVDDHRYARPSLAPWLRPRPGAFDAAEMAGKRGERRRTWIWSHRISSGNPGAPALTSQRFYLRGAPGVSDQGASRVRHSAGAQE